MNIMAQKTQLQSDIDSLYDRFADLQNEIDDLRHEMQVIEEEIETLEQRYYSISITDFATDVCRLYELSRDEQFLPSYREAWLDELNLLLDDSDPDGEGIYDDIKECVNDASSERWQLDKLIRCLALTNGELHYA